MGRRSSQSWRSASFSGENGKPHMGFVESERFLDGLVQRSSGASGRPNGAEIRGAENDASGDGREKRWAATATFLVGKSGCTTEMALPRWQKGGLHCGWSASRRRQVCRAVGLRPVTGSKGWGLVSSNLGTLFGPRSCRWTRYCTPGSGLCPGPTKGYAQGLARVQGEGRRRG